MYKSLLIIVLLLLTTQGEDISYKDVCTCAQIKSKTDCASMTGCSWTQGSTSGSCAGTIVTVTTTFPVSMVCPAIAKPELDCPITKGCANFDSKCSFFTGCTAYTKTTHAECQAVSNQCTTNGTICIDPRLCSEYTVELDCKTNISKGGSGKCVWDATATTKCRDQVCKEADVTLDTDAKCAKFLTGCVTTGKGCTSERTVCNKYTGTNITCDGYIGTDGRCEGDAGGTVCKARLCPNASDAFTTDAQCVAYQYGCITRGKGCVLAPLPLCSAYTADAATCQVLVGADGNCHNNVNGTQCKVRDCIDAATTLNTDVLCAKFKAGCLSTGKGCAITRGVCSTYRGTKTTCADFIGSDGKCEGAADTEANCTVKVCANAPATATSDAQCGVYQTGCVWNGVKCATSLLLCSQYGGTADTCAKYIGSNGKCKGVGTTDIPCSVLLCSDAPTSLTTNILCNNFQTGCISNGAGCQDKTTCLSTQKQVSCEGTTSCIWNNICISNTSCVNYNTVSLCKNNLGGGKSCFWTGSACRELDCSDAPTTLISNEDCDKYMKGCLTNRAGCINSTKDCTQYKGTQTICASFVGNSIKCWNLSSATSDTPCIVRDCTHDVTTTTNDGCIAFQTGCVTKGTGCISKTEQCTAYMGNQTTCQQFNGVNGTKKCWADSSNVGSCRDKVCSDDILSTTNAACESFLSGCLTKGTGCIEKTSVCTSYPGASTSVCEKFIGNNKNCWWVSGSSCVDKLCSHNSTASSDTECQAFLAGCVTTGTGCISSTEECTAYQGNQANCNKFTGNSKICLRKSVCIDRVCSDLTTAGSSTECTSYLSTCRYNGTTCVNAAASCNAYGSLTAELCTGLTTLSGAKCYLDAGIGTCLDRVCSQKISASSQLECTQFMTGCIFTGSTCVNQQSSCASYLNFTSDACRAAVDTSNVKCWKNATTFGNCESRQCNNTLSVYNSAACTAQLATCVYNGNICADKQTTCAAYTGFTQAACKEVTTSSGEACWKEAGGTGTCESRACTNTIVSPSDTNCKAHKADCRYDGTSCVVSQTGCTLYTVFTQAACQIVTLTNGTEKCWKATSTVGACEVRACTDTVVSPSSVNCVAHISTCRFNGTSCLVSQASCSLYTGFTQLACQDTTLTDGTKCWKTTASVGNCESRTCNNVVSNPSTPNCLAHLSTCRYNGTTCVDQQSTCAAYTAFTQDACKAAVLADGTTKCWKTSATAGVCEVRTCDNVITYSAANCTAHLSTCVFNGSTCMTGQAACTSYTGLLASQCQNILTTGGTKCWLATGSGNCEVRLCTHDTVSTTDEACALFLTGCVTNGKGCVPATQACSSYIGTTTSCLKYVGNSIKCKGQDTTGQCTAKTCFDDTVSTTDAQCNAFLAGCVTRGVGCLPSTEPCSSYQGIKTTCELLTGAGRKCWNTTAAIATTPCIDRQCEYNVTATTNTECASFLTGCLTKGAGCINAIAPCSSYTGTQSACSNFVGVSGTKKCWNVNGSTSSTPCVDRICSHQSTATTNEECAQFMTGCVTKGTGCVSPQACTSFLGTTRTCPNYTATDGPCKGVSLNSAPCLPQICSEAPNTYNTNAICNTFKAGCVTNGFGCVPSVNCVDIQDGTACSARTDCLYTGNCRTLQPDCTTFASASICVNTAVSTTTKRCTWANNLCRNWTCDDAPQNLNSDTACSALNSTCTTKGAGCVTKGKCTSYNNSQTTCTAAKTTDVGDICIWENNACRPKKCEDGPSIYITDEECNSYLAGCKTSGKGCLTVPFTCDKIKSQVKCTVDSNKYPCISFTDKCVPFAQCTDAKETTHVNCQKYSLQCTSDGITCIPITLCSKYTNPFSCIVGTDGVCGWVAATANTSAACQKFEKCDQVKQITKELCQIYSTKCVSDGINCVLYEKCETYKTEIACNSIGTDGVCQWKDSKCALRVCTDATVSNAGAVNNHQSCYNFAATTKCTTKGDGCIPLAKCSTYIEAGCVIGTDGNCIYGFPAGELQGTKVCRPKVCSDIKELTSTLCQAALKDCVSNSTNCIAKTTCDKYTDKEACYGGGTDGKCTFTAAAVNSLKGTCKLMSKCSDADKDEAGCNQMSSSCKFNRTYVNSLETTTCATLLCSNVAEGSNCKVLPKFDGTTFTVCVPSDTGCQVGAGNNLGATNCFSLSGKTYSWNQTTNLCEKCVANAVVPTDDPAVTPSTETTSGTIFRVLLMVMAMLF